MPTWREVIQDENYQKLPLGEKIKTKNEFFKYTISQSEKFKNLPPEKQSQIKTSFFTPKSEENLEPFREEKPTFGGVIRKATEEFQTKSPFALLDKPVEQVASFIEPDKAEEGVKGALKFIPRQMAAEVLRAYKPSTAGAFGLGMKIAKPVLKPLAKPMGKFIGKITPEPIKKFLTKELTVGRGQPKAYQEMAQQALLERQAGGREAEQVAKTLTTKPIIPEETSILNKQSQEIMNFVVKEKQPILNSIGKEISGNVKGEYFGHAKDFQRLAEKVLRKQKETPEYNLFSPKDHARGTIQVNSWGEVIEVVNQLKAKDFIVEETINKPLNIFGYRGINSYKSLGSGINGEIQIHTSTSWKVKMITDKIYLRWRNFTTTDISNLSPLQKLRYNYDIKKSRNLWKNYFDRIPSEIKSSISESSKGLESVTIPKVTPTGLTQEPFSRTFQSAPSSQINEPFLNLETKGKVFIEPSKVNIPVKEGLVKRIPLSLEEQRYVGRIVRKEIDIGGKLSRVAESPEITQKIAKNVEVEVAFNPKVKSLQDDLELVNKALRDKETLAKGLIGKEFKTETGFIEKATGVSKVAKIKPSGKPSAKRFNIGVISEPVSPVPPTVSPIPAMFAGEEEKIVRGIGQVSKLPTVNKFQNLSRQSLSQQRKTLSHQLQNEIKDIELGVRSNYHLFDRTFSEQIRTLTGNGDGSVNTDIERDEKCTNQILKTNA